MIRHIQSPGIVKTVSSSIYQGFLRIFKDIDACSATRTDAQLEEEGRGFPCPFLKIKKSARFRKKRPDCVHLLFKLSIQNVGLKKNLGQKLHNISRETFFSCVFDEMFIKVT